MRGVLHQFTNGELASADANRFRLAGTVYLCLAVITNVGTGAALVYVGRSDGVVQWAFVELQRYLTAQQLVQEANTIAMLLTTGLTFVGLFILALGILGVAIVVDAVRTGRDDRLFQTSIISALNPLALPLAAIAGALFWYGR